MIAAAGRAVASVCARSAVSGAISSALAAALEIGRISAERSRLEKAAGAVCGLVAPRRTTPIEALIPISDTHIMTALRHRK